MSLVPDSRFVSAPLRSLDDVELAFQIALLCRPFRTLVRVAIVVTCVFWSGTAANLLLAYAKDEGEQITEQMNTALAPALDQLVQDPAPAQQSRR